jgi:EAL domain-containing protein (putative c-di-GMP-specific phosphodiesterase class I)
VRSAIDLAHNLGLRVVADGVDNDEVFTRLAALGCDAAQGAFVCPPASAAEVRAWREVHCESGVRRNRASL